jgi:transposase
MNNAVVRNKKQITIGLGSGTGDTHCVLDEAGKIAREGSLGNTREQLAAMARSYPGATLVMEAGTDSPWVSRFLQGLGLRTVVANPRKTRAIYENERKSDRRDAMMLARLVRVDPTLLHPIENGSQDALQDMLQLKLCDSLVRARVALINAVRFSLKSLGYPVSNPSSARFHELVLNEVPESIGEMIVHNVAAIAELTERIKALEASISRRPGSAIHRQSISSRFRGVGPITSLYFVLKVGNPGRFERTRDIGAFLDLCPKRDQSGETDKELRISKCADRYLRLLLVSAAQYILGPFGADSALREHGLRLAQEGTASARKRAVVAVARKLAVLLLTLWKSRAPYESFHTMGVNRSDGALRPQTLHPSPRQAFGGNFCTQLRTDDSERLRSKAGSSIRLRQSDGNVPPFAGKLRIKAWTNIPSPDGSTIQRPPRKV